jgi:hypothetical protein
MAGVSVLVAVIPLTVAAPAAHAAGGFIEANELEPGRVACRFRATRGNWWLPETDRRASVDDRHLAVRVDGTPELEIQIELHPHMVVSDGTHAEDVELPFPDELDDASTAAKESD